MTVPSYESVAAECYPTAGQVEREWYGGNQRKRRTTAAHRKRVRLAALAPADRTSVRILGGVPRPRAPKAAA